jgi:cell division septation protein DedD
MPDESAVATIDDQSHYEISLTAGQAFVAFVLLLLSLAASFAFGLMIGKSQGDDRLVVRKEPTIVTEASVIPKKPQGKIVELGVADDDFKQPDATKTDTAKTTTAVVETPVVTEATTSSGGQAPTPVQTTASAGQAEAPVLHGTSGPVYAQLLSTSDQKTAENLAAKLINGGFFSAYVERSTNEKGTIFRVRVKFPSEGEAKAAEPKLKEFSKDVWITK